MARKPASVFRQHETVTVKHSRERGCYVNKKKVYVRWGGTVTFKSTAGPLTVFVPTPSRASDLFPRSGELFTVPGTRDGKTLTVVVAKPKKRGPQAYWYTVYCHACQCFAKASFPEIIIGP
jgi:hypothetical protein